jgi:membrane protease YdiL (CAAX protease family)
VRHLRIFFIATIAWTWTVGFVFVLIGLNNSPIGEIVFLFAAGVAPSAVGLVMVFTTYTKQARVDYFRRFIPTWRGMWFVLVYAALLLGLATVVLVGFFDEPPDFLTVTGFISNPLTILTFVFFMYMWGPVNEEFGWRGYALDKMIIRHGFVKGSLMLGFVWGIWHLPWIFFAGQWQARAFQVSPWWFAVYVAQCMLLSVVISIAYVLSRRSYFIAATVHGVGNVVVGLIYFEVSLSGTIWYSITAIGVSLIIITVTFGPFGMRFREEQDKQVEQIHHDREKFGTNAAYRT